MTRLDWIIVGFAAFTALMGYRRGLVRAALSLAGLAAGAVIGARIAPHVLSGGPPQDGEKHRPILADRYPRVGALHQREIMALPRRPTVEGDERCAVRHRKIALLDDDRGRDKVARVFRIDG